MMKLAFPFILIVFTGCAGLVPSEKHQSQSVKATEAIATESERTTRRTFSVVPEMAATVNSNGVPVAVHESVSESTRVSTGAGSRSDAKGSSTVSIPLFVKLIGAGLGLIALTFGVRYMLAASKGTGFGAGLSLGDKALGGGIDAIANFLSSAKDDGEIARLTALRAHFEKERGKLSSAKLR